MNKHPSYCSQQVAAADSSFMMNRSGRGTKARASVAAKAVLIRSYTTSDMAVKDEVNFEGSKIGPLDRWVLEKQLGKGSYGQVWLAHDMSTNEKCAVKFESAKTPRPVLYLEYMFYKKIDLVTKTERTPKILTLCPFTDSEGGAWTCLVMECMGKSLEQLISRFKRFSIKTTLQLAIELMTIIEAVHKSGIIHRDIKPDNFMFGLKENGRDRTLCIIDFGMSKFYINPDTQRHISAGPNSMVVGTPRYQSANAHKYRVQCRRDDLESICYVIVFFAMGKLPWQGMDIDSPRRKSRITARMKVMTPSAELCKGLPDEFPELIRRVKALRFDETPDYRAYRTLLASCAEKMAIQLDNVYDWDQQG